MTRALWITRAQPGADATAARLRALGFEAVVAPLLEVRRKPGDIDLAGVAAIAFTSANAVAAFAERSDARRLPVFTVGDATAAAARRAGFVDVASAHGDVAALAALLARRRAELDGVILYPAAADPAQDLAARLAEAGFAVSQTALYETVAVAPEAALTARLGALDGVLLHSARAAAGLAAYLQRHPAPQLIAYCLSPQIAAVLDPARLAQVAIAETPNEAALLALIEKSAAA